MGWSCSALVCVAARSAAVERGRDFLRNRLATVQSSEVEAVTGLDRYQFARQFRAVYGTSPYVKLCAARAGDGTARPAALATRPNG
jgi:hypothetical protein